MGNGPVEWCKHPVDDSKNELMDGHGGIATIMLMRQPAPQYMSFTRTVSRVNLISELDYALSQLSLRKVKHPNDRVLQLTAGWEEESDYVSVVSSKTYSPSLPRYDSANNRENGQQLGLFELSNINTNKKSRYLSKLRELRTAEPSEEAQKICKVVHDELNRIEGMSELIWDMEWRDCHESMSQHLLYNLNSFLPYLNSSLSLNDTSSLTSARHTYHYIRKHICTQQVHVSKHYFLDLNLTQPQVELFQAGCAVFFPTFAGFDPLPEQDKSEASSTKDMGEEKVSATHVMLNIAPLPITKQANKFRYYRQLIYLPFSVFGVQKVVERSWGKEIRLVELEQQPIIAYISEQGQPTQPKKTDPESLIEELKKIRESVNDYVIEQLEQEEVEPKQEEGKLIPEQVTKKKKQLREKYKRLAKEYYQTYQLNSQQVKNINEMAEEEIKLGVGKVEQEVEAEKESELSELGWVQISGGQEVQLGKRLDKYMENIELVKLVDQVISVDRFWQLTSLNLSQSFLQRIQCMECFPNLNELYLYSNCITKLEGLTNNHNLRVLSLSRNSLSLLENIEHLRHLTQLYITKNKFGQQSATYFADIKLEKLRILTISFANNHDSCVERALKDPPPRLKQLVLNEGARLSVRTKRGLPRWLPKRTKLTIFDG